MSAIFNPAIFDPLLFDAGANSPGHVFDGHIFDWQIFDAQDFSTAYQFRRNARTVRVMRQLREMAVAGESRVLMLAPQIRTYMSKERNDVCH